MIQTINTFITAIALALIATTTSVVHALPPSIIRAVDRDASAVYFGYSEKPDDSTLSAQNTLQTTTAFIDQLDRMGILSNIDASIRYWIDIFTALNDIKDFPHAVVLYRIDASPRDDGGHQLAQMKAALIIHTDGDNTRIEQRIQQLLNRYTNNDEASLTIASVDGDPIYVLRNKRLPDWAMINWGKVGPYYVISIGKGVYHRTQRAINQPSKSLITDPWFGRAFSTTQGSHAMLGWYVRFDSLQLNADPLFVEKVKMVQNSIGLNNVQRGLWMVSTEDRAVHMSGYVQRGNKNELQKYTNDDLAKSFSQKLIPQQASSYTVMDFNPHGLLVGLNEAYLATRSPSAQLRCKEFWQKVQSGAHLSLEKDLYAHLDKPMIIHNFPRHAFGLPFAWTILMRIKDHSDMLRMRVDQLLDFISREMMKDSLLQLRRDDDGVWYLFAGIMGPALKVTDQWVIISFSPVALRQNIAMWQDKKSIRQSPDPE